MRGSCSMENFIVSDGVCVGLGLLPIWSVSTAPPPHTFSIHLASLFLLAHQFPDKSRHELWILWLCGYTRSQQDRCTVRLWRMRSPNVWNAVIALCYFSILCRVEQDMRGFPYMQRRKIGDNKQGCVHDWLLETTHSSIATIYEVPILIDICPSYVMDHTIHGVTCTISLYSYFAYICRWTL